tara:strand:- start:7542 stop:8120 length:579 start_codon:yes stop_codon:yes gene_type:complete
MNLVEIFNNILEKDDINLNNRCLISHEILDDNYINLPCNHSFNYIHLYNEIYYQKTKKILDNKKLKIFQMKCPYCREKCDYLLPYYKYYNIKDVKGVTNPTRFCLSDSRNKCQICNNNGCVTKKGIFCNKHTKLNFEEENILVNKDIVVYDKLKKYKKTELVEILKKNNIKISGNKDTLIERILINKINIDK